MSQTNRPSFDWPVGLSRVPDQARPTKPSSPGILKVTNTANSTSHIHSAMHSYDCITTTIRTIYVTVSSTVVHKPGRKVTKDSLIHQTKPLEFHAPATPTKPHPPIPELTVASFQIYSAPIKTLSTAVSTATTSNPALDTTTKQTTKPPLFSPAEIAGLTLGLLAIIGLSIAAALFLHCRRAAKSRRDAESLSSEEVLDAKIQRAQDLGRQRRSLRDTMMKARNLAPVQDSREVTRRPSGLFMHPPTPVVADFKIGEDGDIGRAV
ncbi:hypothetical protein OPT61_g5634 [Boeremia exigua]|uniref:Uncharacterized protein n=1 Tax=Boeremia exigua TaxID=749465 RepID=A0ACC2I9J5_9PLEO|nr:hypothetical protein OPT61_g5634 [Boeremia exigua]